MKVALVTSSFPALSETFIYNQAAGLRAAGVDVTVIVAKPSNDGPLFADFDGLKYEGPIVEANLADGIRRATTHLPRDLTLLRAAQRLHGMTKRAVRAWVLAQPCIGFDVVHFEHSGLAVAWLDALPLLAPSRLVVSCRGSAERITPLIDANRAEALRSMFAMVDRVHCVSNNMVGTCATYGLDPARAFVNHPAVDVARFRRTSPYEARTTGPYRLLSTGRLHWVKGLEYALVAVRSLLDAGHEVHYELIGAGPDEAHLRFTVQDLQLTKHVTFAGKRTSAEARAALERCDVFLLPSVSEGISNAALEAMAMGIPVVSTTAGGMPEAITDGVDGILVRPRSAEQLALRIGDVLGDPSNRRAIGLAASSRAARDFAFERQLQVFLMEYQLLIEHPAV